MSTHSRDEPAWRAIGRTGGDLAVVAVVALAIGAFQTLLPGSSNPLRVLGGLLLLFVLPGYAGIAALFPRSDPIVSRASRSVTGFFSKRDGPVDEDRTIVRLALSLAGSVTVSSLLGILLGLTVGLTTATVAVGLTAFTVVCSAVALVRRHRVPERERYTPFDRGRLAGATRSFGGVYFGRVLRIVVVASLLLSLVSAAYAVSVPRQGETPTELYLLTENESGNLTASGYPDTLSTRGQETLHVGVTSHEPDRTEFGVLVTLDRVSTEGNRSRVTDRTPVAQYSMTLAPGETWQREYRFTPLENGSNFRLTHSLYRGEIPENATSDDAYRVTYIYVSVTGPSIE